MANFLVRVSRKFILERVREESEVDHDSGCENVKEDTYLYVRG